MYAIRSYYDYLEARNRVHQKTSLALIYPAVLSVVAIGVVIALRCGESLVRGFANILS